MNRRIPRYILCLDILWLLFALGVSYALRYGALVPYAASFYPLLALAAAGFWIALFAAIRLDCLEGGWRLHVVLSKIAMGTIFLMAFVLTFAYLARLYYSRLMLCYFAALLFFGFLMIRAGTYVFLCRQHRKGRARRVVLLGSERFILEFISKIFRHPELLYEVVGTLYTVRTGEAGNGATTESCKTALSSEDALSALSERQVAELIVLLDESPGLEFQSFIALCREQGMAVSVLPHGYELYTSKPRLVEIDGFPLVSLEQRSVGPAAAVVKRAMDLVISVLLLSPAALIVAFSGAIMLSKRRRVFRRELRIGRNGRAFWMYRFDIDNTAENVPAYERSLLRLSISEVPQLWNVLRGEMSLVGPRPESPNRVKNYSEWQQQRLKAKPGMTGLAQVNGLRNRHASEEKTHYDLQYMLEWTPFMDVVLLLRTLSALARRCFPRPDATEVLSPVCAAKNSSVPVGRRDTVGEMVHADRT